MDTGPPDPSNNSLKLAQAQDYFAYPPASASQGVTPTSPCVSDTHSCCLRKTSDGVRLKRPPGRRVSGTAVGSVSPRRPPGGRRPCCGSGSAVSGDRADRGRTPTRRRRHGWGADRQPPRTPSPSRCGRGPRPGARAWPGGAISRSTAEPGPARDVRGLTPALRISVRTSATCAAVCTVTTMPSAPARAVRPDRWSVGLVLGRRVGVHHQVDAVHVDAAGGDVGRDHGADLAGGERRQVPGARALGQVAVQFGGQRARQGQLADELARPVLGPG